MYPADARSGHCRLAVTSRPTLSEPRTRNGREKVTLLDLRRQRQDLRGAGAEPGEAGALETEVRARTERHLAAIEERRGRVIAQPQVPAVQPGQEGRGAGNVADLMQLL